jgi:glucose-6-phosphate 1-dehydrogenase
MNKPENLILVIFGASGDLTKRKLIPALLDLKVKKLLPDRFAILGVSRSKMSDDTFRDKIMESLPDFSPEHADKTNVVNEFIKTLHYISINTSEGDDYKLVKEKIDHLDDVFQTRGNIIFYLSTPPSLYDVIPKNLARVNLNASGDENSFRRLIVEKPFGIDLSSGKRLNKNLLKYFRENEIYRIDHYLGKETVQNIMVTRFSNGIFEPLWNRNYINHVEITAAENIGVGSRGGYYDSSGALRDMVQNHLLQLVGLTAMEPPTVIESHAIRNETLKVFQAFRPLKTEDIHKNVIRGQYTDSMIRGEKVPGYRDEEGVKNNSRTETYFAMKFYIDSWRWGGVPFYVRTGKRLPTRASEIVINFKKTPHSLFLHNNKIKCSSNQLIMRIQPDEGILLKFDMKVPGAGFQVQTVNMDFHYKDLKENNLPSAYERLLLDCMQGDTTLYARGDAVEAAWQFVQPVISLWENNPSFPLHGYPAGTWGPEEAEKLFDYPEFNWRYPCKNLVNDGEYCEL